MVADYNLTILPVDKQQIAGDLTESWTQTRQERARAKRANLEVTILMLLLLLLLLLLPPSKLSVD